MKCISSTADALHMQRAKNFKALIEETAARSLAALCCLHTTDCYCSFFVCASAFPPNCSMQVLEMVIFLCVSELEKLTAAVICCSISSVDVFIGQHFSIH